MAQKRELWFLAECETANGDKKSIWVDRQGSSVYLSLSGNGNASHLCHTSVSTIEQVKGEISVVYSFTVTSTKSPGELASVAKQASSQKTTAESSE